MHARAWLCVCVCVCVCERERERTVLTNMLIFAVDGCGHVHVLTHPACARLGVPARGEIAIQFTAITIHSILKYDWGEIRLQTGSTFPLDTRGGGGAPLPLLLLLLLLRFQRSASRCGPLHPLTLRPHPKPQPPPSSVAFHGGRGPVSVPRGIDRPSSVSIPHAMWAGGSRMDHTSSCASLVRITSMCAHDMKSRFTQDIT